MKISEIRNSLFGLTDLKGLITESLFYESGGEGALDWEGFFAEDPERLNTGFMELLGLGRGGVQIGPNQLANYFGEDVIAQKCQNMKSFKEAFKNARTKNRTKLFGAKTMVKDINEPVNLLKNYFRSKFQSERATPDDVVTIYNIALEARSNSEVASINIPFNPNNVNPSDSFSLFLMLFYDLQMGSGKKVRKNINVTLEALKNYDQLNGTSFFNAVSSLVGNYAQSKKLSVEGYATVIEETLLAPLNLRYSNMVDQGIASTILNTYFNNPGLPELYNTLSELKNNGLEGELNAKNLNKSKNMVGGLILGSLIIIDYSFGGYFDDAIEIVTNNFSGQQLVPFRVSSFRSVYERKFGLAGEYMKNLLDCFGLSQEKMFDFLTYSADINTINNGIVRWFAIYGEDGIKKLASVGLGSYTPQSEDNTPTSSIEKIAGVADSIQNLFGNSFSKYNISKRVSISVADLLGNATDGLAKMASFKKDIPVPQKRLVAISESLGERDVKFWEVLSADNAIQDKTQRDIFEFLRHNSDGDVIWDYEYNRPGKSDKVDEGLGQKSIDIMGTKNVNGKDVVICFEYQGQQHYRPLNVRKTDYDNEFFTNLRDEILKLCGFVVVGKNGTRFVKRATVGSLTEQEKRAAIIAAYSAKLTELSDLAAAQQKAGANSNILFKEPKADPDTRKRGVVKEVFAFKKLNRRDVSTQEALDYFAEIVERGIDDKSVFGNPEIGGLIPYIGSPYRYLEEIKVAQDMTNDQMKSEVIKDRGWIMSYVIPADCTEDEVKYTEMMASNPEAVFTWNSEGKDRLISFLFENDFRGQIVSENRSSLFGDIVREFLRENSFE